MTSTRSDGAGHGGPPSTGAPADRYDLGEILGRGGMAVVHRARDRVLDREVAVKVLRDTVDDSERRRFTDEARTLARLSHVGLVTVLDAGVSDERPFLVMELVEGPTLAETLRGGALPAAQVTSIGAQLARALAYAHDAGIVHRDVKPANVLLGQHVKLADFGIARLMGETVRHTRTGTTIGTAAYLSPEQVQGDAIGTATDIYSLALVLLEALTGVRAFPGSPTEAAVARLHRAPAIPDELPEPWPALLRDMTAMRPADRPSAAAVADRVEAGPSETPIPGPVDRTRVMPSATASVLSSTAAARGPSPLDRAGDAVARTVVGAWRKVAAASEHQKGAAAAIVLLVVLLAVTAAIAREDPAPGNDVPPTTPTELREPLRDLHDAIYGTAG